RWREIARRKFLEGRAVETHGPARRDDPQVAVGGLRQRGDLVVRQPVVGTPDAHRPRRVGRRRERRGGERACENRGREAQPVPGLLHVDGDTTNFPRRKAPDITQTWYSRWSALPPTRWPRASSEVERLDPKPLLGI